MIINYKTIIAIALFFFTATLFATTKFIDKTTEFGLKLNKNQVAFIDYNNDGWVDIYSPPILWKNNQGKNYNKVFTKGRNGIWADFDNDGFSDLFCYSNQKLFKNNGNNLTPVPFPKLPIESSLGACWGDFNNDGFVDLYIGGYENRKKGKTYPDIMLLNKQGKSFTKSFVDPGSHTRGVTCCDFDNDGDIDIYTSNYRLSPNILWQNNGQGKLKNIATTHNATATKKGFEGSHSIGAVFADFDNDGNIDIFAGNFAHKDSRGSQPESIFLRNNGAKENYTFKNMGQCGLHYQESYASPAVADYDNDGDLDLFFTTVYDTASFSKKNHPVLYRNDGNWNFIDVTKECNLANLRSTYQAAWADCDNDGDVDLITNAKFFVNQGNNNSWLKVKLQGDGKTINKDAIGSQVRIKLNGKTLTRQVEAGTGQGNQNELTLHFGLGKTKNNIEIEIFWAKEITQTVKNIKPNQIITLKFDNNSDKEAN